MALEFMTNFLLIKPKPGDFPKPGDSEETVQRKEEMLAQKQIINHAIQTYFQFSTAEKIGDTILSQFLPKQVLLNRITKEGVGAEDASNAMGITKDISTIAKLLGARKFMPFF